MLICESARNSGGFKKYKPNVRKLHNELSKSFKEANENWIKTILPFRDSDSPFYKLFINRDPNKGRISS